MPRERVHPFVVLWHIHSWATYDPAEHVCGLTDDGFASAPVDWGRVVCNALLGHLDGVCNAVLRRLGGGGGFARERGARSRSVLTVNNQRFVGRELEGFLHVNALV